ncbi:MULTISPECIES: GNAT family N-acetyltransferase [Methylobacterium]|jgi:ribosomal protein S18 acetylase RimI-like enzyme|uniref:GNAT family N-acetyltransferase n=2 Tax=Methylobacteriaceae TaxID=119045 RepID=UPI000366A6CE|nr:MULTISPECIES: GNAT family N-acetyltransferase [Methylobacterium]MBN4095243.1 GNAT family N-acetyltransferase [Methylobacterium sp. OT2]UIN32383.1 GNAT family N-acetyltransferase [Methylobacterium oryzae]SEF88268.1 Acetyltransferase (GNAT) family protein [Methylobacterium sp. 190mf]SEO26989.1 Acetyltransferase (GNAT) family protein [Methylobacterium sp. UNC300MFChir4.1]
MNESVALRRGAPADADAIRALVEAAYTKWIPVIGRLPIPMRADYAQALRDHRFDLLVAGPDLAGLIETRTEADHLLVVNVAVHPAFQGRGFGSRLMGRADAVAGEAGLTRLRLYTNKKYTANLRLYGALGYRVEREELYDGPGRTRDDDVTVHMVKDLV